MSTQGRVLLVDDDETAIELMGNLLTDRGYTVATATTVDAAIQRLGNEGFNAAVTDLRMPVRGGMDLLSAATERWPEMPVIMITGHGSIRTAVEALKHGAFEYITKPIQIEELALVLEKAIAHRRLEEQNRFLKGELERTLGYHYHTNNRHLQEVYATIDLIKDQDPSVLIRGESGTGKEVIARLIHNSGHRSAASFVPINCGAIPEHLIESELFGYEKGAFTGAVKRTAGKLEIANGGTLFLDEINELSPRAQVALLRFVQELEIVPLGSSRRVPVNVQLVTATNRDLDALVRAGEFREDLFYRINVLPLTLPPLRERREDIVDLADWFLERTKVISNRAAERFSPAARERLLSYDWPGNIRELRNCVDRATIVCRDAEIGVEHLFLPTQPEPGARNDENDTFCYAGEAPLKAVEDAYIAWTLDRHDGNRAKAAATLGLSTRGLRYRLNRESGR